MYDLHSTIAHIEQLNSLYVTLRNCISYTWTYVGLKSLLLQLKVMDLQTCDCRSEILYTLEIRGPV